MKAQSALARFRVRIVKMAAALPDGVSAAVKITSFQLSKKYLGPTENIDAVTKYITAVMAMLGAWSSWVDHLPQEIRTEDLPLLFGFVISMMFKLTSDVGRALLQQRLDLMQKRPEERWFNLFNCFLEDLNVELEDAVEKVAAYACHLSEPDGLLFDQLLNACLHFASEVRSFNLGHEKVFVQMNAFANKVLSKIYRSAGSTSDDAAFNLDVQ